MPQCTTKLAAGVSLLVLGLAAGAAGMPTPSRPVDSAALDKLVVVTKEICLTPADYGYSVAGEAGANFKGSLPKLIPRLFNAGIGASLKANAEYHKGLPERDLGSAQLSRNMCGANVFDHMLTYLTMTNIATGKIITRPSQPRRYYVSHFEGANVGGTNINQGGSGNIIIQGVNGPVIFQPPAPRAAKNNGELIQNIARFINAGIQIQQQSIKSKSVENIRAQYGQWLSSVDSYLSFQLDESYVAQFDLARSNTASMFSGYSMEGSGFYNQIQSKNETLNTFITELRRASASP